MYRLQGMGDPLIVAIHRERSGDHADEVAYRYRRGGEDGKAQAQGQCAKPPHHFLIMGFPVSRMQEPAEKQTQ
jgi:hypothetical protein